MNNKKEKNSISLASKQSNNSTLVPQAKAMWQFINEQKAIQQSNNSTNLQISNSTNQ
jgi:hypothetical protein